MTQSNISISLIIPCYNEAANIHLGVLDQVGEFVRNDARFAEVVIVDDGSSDDSVSLIKNTYLKKYSTFRLVENEHMGKAIAVITGIQQARGEYVIFTDMDLATPLSEIEKIISKLETGQDIVIGSRLMGRKGAPLARKILATGYVVIRGLMIGLSNITDTQCGCKGFKRDAALKIIEKLRVFTQKRKVQGPSVSAAFDLEFLFIAKKLGYTISEVPVKWHYAESRRVAFFKDAFETLRDLTQMRLNELTGKYA